jgi:heptosyltransferase-1
MPISEILVVRLGAMGDILHALPAAAALKRSWPGCRITWAVHPRWRSLLDGGGVADRLIENDRRDVRSVKSAWFELRRARFDFAIDFQGLIKSALVARASRAGTRYGFDPSQLRESAAALFYSQTVKAGAAHVVDRNLELAARAGAVAGPVEFPLPAGQPEGELPAEPFFLASPLAGWKSKQWPAVHWAGFARLLHERTPYRLVMNGPPAAAGFVSSIPGAHLHVSSIAGLIDATRRAAAVIGLDSGPLHLAAALGRPGVALFGPTEPQRNGPYGNSIRCLRAASAVTSYARKTEIDPSMQALEPETVFRALMDVLEARG